MTIYIQCGMIKSNTMCIWHLIYMCVLICTFTRFKILFVYTHDTRGNIYTTNSCKWQTEICKLFYNNLSNLLTNIHILELELGLWCLMPLSNNISAISWLSVLLVEETGVPWENHWPLTSHWQTWSHDVVSPCCEWYLNSQL